MSGKILSTLKWGPNKRERLDLRKNQDGALRLESGKILSTLKWGPNKRERLGLRKSAKMWLEDL